MNQKFSVIIPVHNKLPHLDRSILSVLNQTYPDFELILVDDASTDGSSEKLLQFKDPRIKLLKRNVPGPGGYAARNLGIAHAAQERICFLDADDEWEPNVLETLAEIIRHVADVEILCWGWTNIKKGVKVVDAYSKKYKHEPIRSFTMTDFFNPPQPMWTGGISLKKELIMKAGGFPEHGFQRGGDMDTWIRCLWHSKKNLRITRPMTYYYLDSVNMVTNSAEKNIAFSFSDFVMKVLLNTNDKQLIKAIRYFQNRRIYTILRERINEGKSIDYDLLFKMNTSMSFYYLALKLHVKKLLSFNYIKHPE
ncbi:glycosyltransferase family 2 protein [Pontibacter beigongshangensis]|uniref:glycosyltransferase family 2 protein n=1 Tax=Pontibacter beigongshangensis TaxID=2574733 RepID=UPI00164FDBC2|nr:glycosyltransferase family A protein [Pontibacter beigongshangensis]